MAWRNSGHRRRLVFWGDPDGWRVVEHAHRRFGWMPNAWDGWGLGTGIDLARGHKIRCGGVAPPSKQMDP